MSSSTQKFVPTPDKQTAFRRALGCFGTGVTVVTTKSDTGPVGFTANSFSSVSLDPPLIQWSVAKDASRHDFFARTDRFCVHILGAEHAEMALHFAKHGNGFDDLDWCSAPDGTPLLNACPARFVCETHAVYPAGDHSLILGHVLEVDVQRDPAPGLLFAQGGFGHFVSTD